MTVSTTEITPDSTPTPVEEQAAAFAKDNPEIAGKVGLDVPKSEEAPASDDRPEWLPEKFKSPEDMAKAYSELEKRQSTSEKPKDPPAEISKTDSDAAESAAEAAGLDLNALSEKYAENGSLEDSDYEALSKVGISKDDVALYVKGREAAANEFSNSVYEAAGSAETYAEAIAWAADNLPDSEVDAFNDAINSMDPARAKLAVTGLLSSFRAAESNAPARHVTGEGASVATVGYTSDAEYMADMRDPRYQSDAGFREKVARRLAATRR